MDLWASFLHRTLLSVSLAALPATQGVRVRAVADSGPSLEESAESAPAAALRPAEENGAELGGVPEPGRRET